MSIKSRIIFTLSFLVFLILAISGYGRYNANTATSLLTNVSLRDAQNEKDLVKIMVAMERNRGQVLLALQHHPEFEFSALHDHPVGNHLKAIQKNSEEIRELWQQYIVDVTDEKEKQLAQGWFQVSGELGTLNIMKAEKHLEKGEWNQAEHLLLGDIARNFNEGGKAATELSQYVNNRLQEHNAKIDADIRIANYIMLSAIGLAVVIAAFFSFSLVRKIIPPLNDAVDVAKRVAAGDLTARVNVTSNDEIGQMMQALKEMNESLVSIVGRVRRDAETIATASTEIAHGNLDLSNRTEQQAGSLEETASSMEQLTSTVRQNGENARHANQLAESAAEVATQGGIAVTRVVETMDEINDASHKIVDIISVIDGIAFQTNILALNAAVEAARAGEQGRGFAVVATEVRSLAQRSATAAREIKSLIDDSVSKVQAGTELVGQATATMQEIGNSIRQVYNIISEISDATQQQIDGIEQVNQAITEMDRTTQQNAALVEEAAAATQTLSDNARELNTAVSVFRVDTASGPGTYARPAAALPAPETMDDTF